MAATRLGDVIVPTRFTQYVRERTAELSLLWTSGIVQPMPQLDGILDGGNTITMPFWQDLTGNSEVLSAVGDALTVNPILASADKAVVLARGRAWGANELAGALAGDDPMGAIADAVARWWSRDMQKTAMSVLSALFATGGPLAGTHLHDISGNAGAQQINGVAMLNAFQRLGDAKDTLTAIAMHSATETTLAIQGMIDYQPAQETQPRIATFMGKRVIVDDSLPNNGTTYDTYLFGGGAVGFAEGNGRLTAVETDRDSLAGEDILINRRFFTLHPRGVKWNGADPTGGGPNNAALATPGNWAKVFDDKNIRIVCLRHNLANT